MLTRIAAVLAAVAVTLGISLAVAPAADADPPFTVGAVTHDCGIATCSVYVSRSGTKSLDQFMDSKVAQYGSFGAEAVVCGSMTLVPIVGIPLGVYCAFRFTQFDQVLDEGAEKNKCFKVTYLRVPAATVTHISTHNEEYCKN